jgi:hypothetical protein
MRKVAGVLLVLSAWGAAAEFQASCSGCSFGKEKVRCDYYVVKKGDRSRSGECRIYAEYVDIDGSYPKAAWYYLLAGDPAKARAAALKGLKQGQGYGREYLAFALWLEKREQEARTQLRRFFQEIPEHHYFRKDLETLKRLYPDAGFGKLLKADGEK